MPEYQQPLCWPGFPGIFRYKHLKFYMAMNTIISATESENGESIVLLLQEI